MNSPLAQDPGLPQQGWGVLESPSPPGFALARHPMRCNWTQRNAHSGSFQKRRNRLSSRRRRGIYSYLQISTSIYTASRRFSDRLHCNCQPGRGRRDLAENNKYHFLPARTAHFGTGVADSGPLGLGRNPRWPRAREPGPWTALGLQSGDPKAWRPGKRDHGDRGLGEPDPWASARIIWGSSRRSPAARPRLKSTCWRPPRPLRRRRRRGSQRGDGADAGARADVRGSRGRAGLAAGRAPAGSWPRGSGRRRTPGTCTGGGAAAPTRRAPPGAAPGAGGWAGLRARQAAGPGPRRRRPRAARGSAPAPAAAAGAPGPRAQPSRPRRARILAEPRLRLRRRPRREYSRRRHRGSRESAPAPGSAPLPQPQPGPRARALRGAGGRGGRAQPSGRAGECALARRDRCAISAKAASAPAAQARPGEAACPDPTTPALPFSAPLGCVGEATGFRERAKALMSGSAPGRWFRGLRVGGGQGMPGQAPARSPARRLL